MRHLVFKEYMLDLINQARSEAGVPGVALGSNAAAQLHAEAMLEHCVGSHWGLDGLKPYMRYALAGGYQVNGETVSASDYCNPQARHRGVKRELLDAMNGFMDSPGHRRAILNPLYTRVNIGTAWAAHRVDVVLHLEGEYIQYDAVPAIEGPVLRMKGQLLDGATLYSPDDLGVQIYYDPMPSPLTRGQVARTYCYSNGRHVASLSRPRPQEGLIRPIAS